MASRNLVEDAGYVTPKVIVNPAVFDETERLLLIQRANRGTWFCPAVRQISVTPRQKSLSKKPKEAGLTVESRRLTRHIGQLPLSLQS